MILINKMELRKLVLLRNLNKKLSLTLYFNNNLINSIYESIDHNFSKKTKVKLLNEIYNIREENDKINEILNDIYINYDIACDI